MALKAWIADGLQSMATRLGTSSDKGASASYTLNLLDDQQLEAAFRTSWVMKKISRSSFNTSSSESRFLVIQCPPSKPSVLA